MSIGVTVFTVSNEPRTLLLAEASLRHQSSQDFEWLVVPYGPNMPERLPVELPQAKVVRYTGDAQNVGAIKAFACAQAAGGVLLELDQDHELFPRAVERVARAFDDDAIDFAYSNWIEVNAEGKASAYDPAYGWKVRELEWQGRTSRVCVAFPPSPLSFSKIWFAPHHVRAWRASFYRRIGGHDAARAVLDDHELLIRTYLNGTPHHLDECLYVVRHPAQGAPTNASRGKAQYVQGVSLDLHDQHIEPMVARWCDLLGYPKVDLCGDGANDSGYRSLDLESAQACADSKGRFPFEDASVGVFRAQDALARLRNPLHVMKEIHRCLVPGGWLLSATPSTDGRGAFQDPTLVSYWNSNSFWNYTRAESAKRVGTPVRFQLNRIKNFFPTPGHERDQVPYVKADLVKVVEGMPGLVEI